MAIYWLEPANDTLHGHFSRDLTPLLTIASGDTIHYRTLDAGWHLFDQTHPFEQAPSFPNRDRQRDPGHALRGQVVCS